MRLSESQDCWLRLLYAPQLSAEKCRGAVAASGSIEALLAASHSTLAGMGFSAATIAALREPDETRLDAGRRWLNTPGCALLTFDSPDWPESLARLDDAPLALWLRGRAALLAEPQLAIVGSRNPSHDGRETAMAFAAHLAQAGLVITSGLASGIDAAAHEGALTATGDTVAVLGCGPDEVYPQGNRALAARIADLGLLVSEYPPGTPPLRHHFPARNRIISGLSLGVLVVEAAARSGSLITARLAAEQGREVFAIPGSIHNPMARGCHRLIREGAKLVETSDDVLGELANQLGPMLRASTPAAADPLPDEPGRASAEVDPDYAKLLSVMEFAPVSMDQLMQRTGLTPETLSSMLLILELQGAVEILPGGRYATRGNAPRKRT